MDARQSSESPSAPAHIDGRRARTLRTRAALVDAVIALQEDGQLKPTAQQIAGRAGTSVRSIFQHFSDQDSLTTAVLDELSRRFGDYRTRIVTAGPLPARIKAFVEARTAMLHRLLPHRRAGNLLEPFSPSIAKRRNGYRQRLRDEIELVFAPEMQRLPTRRRRDVLVAVTVIADWEVWEALWRQTGGDFAATRRILREMLTQQLSAK